MKFKWQLFVLIFLSWVFGFMAGYVKGFFLLICWIGMYIAFWLLPNEKFVKEIIENEKQR